MKIETILHSMLMALSAIKDRDLALSPQPQHMELYDRRNRQYHAFRDRIIRLDERNKMQIASLESENEILKAYIDLIEGD